LDGDGRTGARPACDLCHGLAELGRVFVSGSRRREHGLEDQTVAHQRVSRATCLAPQVSATGSPGHLPHQNTPPERLNQLCHLWEAERSETGCKGCYSRPSEVML